MKYKIAIPITMAVFWANLQRPGWPGHRQHSGGAG